MGMLTAAVVGTHGVGKTSIVHEIGKKKPHWLVLEEAVRTVMPSLEYADAYQFVEKEGIAALEFLLLGRWGLLEYKHWYCQRASDNVLLLDSSPWENLAYYYLLRTPREKKHEKTLNQLAYRAASKIDVYLLVEQGVCEFTEDRLRTKNMQENHEQWLRKVMADAGIEPIILSEVSVDDRTEEVIGILEGNR